ncbi:hypothetical protein DSO57_1013529 [Entomophthora muscae]|uniref:Uncharacterized protein n=2 Tax=Entomophthora muscae TaxID=34485 RepID=A0ACC2TWL2_9FUNG|nr:hypothetical protein DSO57_1003604 [Entomophthora muscae]KAJ9085483.1 hypothetical protein DSO57_1013529 [Entomophthora muscae]
MSAFPSSRFELLQNPHLKRKDMSSDEEYEFDTCEDGLDLPIHTLGKKHHVLGEHSLQFQATERVCNLNELLPQKTPARAPIYSRWSTCLFGGDDF